MIESTFEIATQVVLHEMEPVVDDSGVTSCVVMVIATVDGSTRRFVFTTDDLRKMIKLFEESLG